MTTFPFERLAIGGWPRTGKTTLANELGARLGIRVRHTDDLVGKVSIEDASHVVADWLDEPGPVIIEGVTVTRGLRKWHERDKLAAARELRPFRPPPVDAYLHMTHPMVSVTVQQAAMGKGTDTVLKDIKHWIEKVQCSESAYMF